MLSAWGVRCHAMYVCSMRSSDVDGCTLNRLRSDSVLPRKVEGSTDALNGPRFSTHIYTKTKNTVSCVSWLFEFFGFFLSILHHFGEHSGSLRPRGCSCQKSKNVRKKFVSHFWVKKCNLSSRKCSLRHQPFISTSSLWGCFMSMDVGLFEPGAVVHRHFLLRRNPAFRSILLTCKITSFYLVHFFFKNIACMKRNASVIKWPRFR